MIDKGHVWDRARLDGWLVYEEGLDLECGMRRLTVRHDSSYGIITEYFQ